MAKEAKTVDSTISNRQIMTNGQKIFQVFSSTVLVILLLICLLPFWYLICLSLSENSAVMAGRVGLWPVNFTLESYSYVLDRMPFWRAFWITIQRVLFSLPLNLILILLSAYPLSKDTLKFRSRSIYVWFFFLTMLFNGGMIPNYLLVNRMGMLDTIWALVFPGCINVFNMLLILSFFRQIPGELEDAAYVDGAGHWRILWQIYVPISVPVIATVVLFTLVGHWNSWFDGLIYMRNTVHYPLQTYLRSIIVDFDFTMLTPEEQARLAQMNVRSIKSAQMVIGAIPILMVYPFLQKYFVTGITLGSVKG
jgi:putative aldouronate transport system permease protein